jgi:hypothetical protein
MFVERKGKEIRQIWEGRIKGQSDIFEEIQMQYFKEEKDRLVCLLCSYYCKLEKGQSGICGVNKNIGDKIIMNLEANKGILLFENHKTKPKKISDTLISFYNFLSRDSILYLGTSTYGLAYAKWKNVLTNKKINWRFISKEKGNHLYNNVCIAERWCMVIIGRRKR